MNNKGFIHTLEATFAVLIILSLILILIPKQVPDTSTPNNLQQAFHTIFTETAINESFRDCLLGIDTFGKLQDLNEPCIANTNLIPFIESTVPSRYNYLIEICGTATTCTADLYNHLPVDESVYTESSFIASRPSRIIRIYFWEK